MCSGVFSKWSEVKWSEVQVQVSTDKLFRIGLHIKIVLYISDIVKKKKKFR